ncbi:rab11 family-interacting protein 1 isoform X3 [Paramormyrops kingsleyae]|uniref:rab11 family-interacting protein 1 isoform X3 n=1 Tax=Paramormyrops kingsleyae TaxID=1676925 RepID=UPI000CD60BB9|nr:rab11 family-interacting protein 2-like isoform X4 [Paramormyrops kingsleyae]
MSLASQSQQWYPTSVQVTVFQARNLRIKGKNGTNDAYAIIQVAKDKFSTSVVEKCVSPVWKEEATFDLPLFHRGNADRCTLYIIVMHRALVGLDKLLGQAVINLLELHENKSRNKTEWFKLVDKNGKTDKDRGEVLLDIQFMRNNITASMFDLSMQEKPRSHIGKLKDKIRGKKSGFSDSASAIVPSVSQVMTDSEEDGDAHAEPSGAKKKSKIKSLFGPKSNLQRNVSQSMSTLGTLPEKNSALSGSRSSGLNVDSPEAKKKFKFLTHKRTDSSDSRTSLGPFSLLNRSKQNVVEQSGVCINGSHVYAEETEPKTSTLSLPNSNQGSAEDVRPVLGRNPSDVSVDSLKGLSLPSYRAESRQKTQLEEDRQQAERVQEERARLEEQQRRREEQDKRKLEEERRKQLEEQQKKQEEEERRKQEEARRAEERRRQEDVKKSVEASNREEPTVTDRLSSLFGIGRKKEEHPAASQEEKRGVEDPPAPGSTNPFEEIPLSPEPQNPFGESSPQASQSLQNSTGFPNRTAKVFPVKPRPHPVKPLGSESLISASTVQGRDSKPTETHEPVLRKPKVIASESGPYSQLTQEELITLVVKQQAEISKKDAKILELEEYIDNLLVRVIDEKPSILMSMPTSKKAF